MGTSKRISTKIENKSFSCEFDSNSRGRVIRLTEAHLNKSYTLLGEETLFGWLADSLEEGLQTPKPQKFFRKTFCNGGFTWIQKTTKKRGSFLEISKVLKSGKKGNIVVPAGVDLKGWESFRRLLKDFLNDEVDSRAFHSEIGSRMESHYQLRHPLRISNHGGYPRITLSQEEGRSKGEKRVRKICWEDTLVVTKRDFHDDWQRILDVLQNQTQKTFIINPFHADKALLKCPDQTIARLLTMNKDWATYGPLTLKMEWWDPKNMGEWRLFHLMEDGSN